MRVFTKGGYGKRRRMNKIYKEYLDKVIGDMSPETENDLLKAMLEDFIIEWELSEDMTIGELIKYCAEMT